MNPALPEGTPGEQTELASGQWQASGRLSYAGIPYSKLQRGTNTAPNPDGLSVNVHLATAQLQVVAPFGTQLSVQLPVGRLTTQTMQSDRTDTNLGDAEIRLRHTLPWLRKPRFEVGGGIALPTGPYVEKSGAANLPPEASFLTLGRGVSWGILEAQASVPIASSASTYVQLSGRMPLSQTEDRFDWGNEARAVVGTQWALGYGISALGIAELQWRGHASEPDPFAGGRVESANAGGTWWTVTPAVSYRATEEVSILGGVRVPLRSNVYGNQLVPGVGGFVSLSTVWSSAAKAKEAQKLDIGKTAFIKPEAIKGSITIIDYWATWCAPCKKIDASLSAAEPRWSNVEIVKVDSTGWPDDGVVLPDGAEGLPVIEIYDVTGTRRHVLKGKEALLVVDIVNKMITETSSNPETLAK